MKTKWLLPIFIFILSLFVVSQQQIAIPNQESVIQFSSADVSLFESQNAIAIVKKQLQDIGAENIPLYRMNIELK